MFPPLAVTGSRKFLPSQNFKIYSYIFFSPRASGSRPRLIVDLFNASTPPSLSLCLSCTNIAGTWRPELLHSVPFSPTPRMNKRKWFDMEVGLDPRLDLIWPSERRPREAQKKLRTSDISYYQSYSFRSWGSKVFADVDRLDLHVTKPTRWVYWSQRIPVSWKIPHGKYKCHICS